jgi:hypothetical protein
MTHFVIRGLRTWEADTPSDGLGLSRVPILQRGRTARTAMRRLVRLPCRVVRARDAYPLAEKTLDVSCGGLRVPTWAKVLTGELVRIELQLPVTGRWIAAEGHVARVLHGRRPGDLGRALGLEFTSLERDARRELAVGLRGVPPPLPMRAR